MLNGITDHCKIHIPKRRRVNQPTMLDNALPMPLSSVASTLGIAIRVDPGHEAANAAVRQCNARIGGTVIEIDRVTIRCQRTASPS